MSQEMVVEPAEPSQDEHTGFREALRLATPVAFVTPALVALNVLVFIVMTIKGVPFMRPGAHQVLPWGANFGPLTSSGQWWRLLTACFLHFGILHIAVNMYVLLQVGTFTERLFGNLRFALLYLVAGVGGNVAGLYFHPFVVGAGASGAIFGVFGGLLAYLLVQRGVVPRESASGIAKSAGLFILYNLIAGLARPETDQVAHIGGITIGFVVGCVLARPLARGRAHVRPGLALAVAAVCTGLGFAAVRHLPPRSAEQTSWYTALLTGKNVTVGRNDRVVYSGTSTQEQAQQVAAVMTRSGIFQPAEVAVLLHRDDTGATVSIPLRADSDQSGKPNASDSSGKPEKQTSLHVMAWDDPKVLATFRTIGPELATAAGGPPLTIRLVSSTGELKNQLRIVTGQIMVGAHDRLVYTPPFRISEVQAVGTALRSADVFRDTGAVALLTRIPSGNDLVLFPTRAGWPPSVTAQSVQDLAQTLIPVTGSPLAIRMTDSAGQVQFAVTAR